MTVYVWHMTAMVGAALVFWGMGWLPTASVGATAWWLQKVPLTLLALVFLLGIVALVAPAERRALLAPATVWGGGPASMLLAAAGVSAALKAWSTAAPATLSVGMVALLGLWHGVLRVDAGGAR